MGHGIWVVYVMQRRSLRLIKGRWNLTRVTINISMKWLKIWDINIVRLSFSTLHIWQSLGKMVTLLGIESRALLLMRLKTAATGAYPACLTHGMRFSMHNSCRWIIQQRELFRYKLMFASWSLVIILFYRCLLQALFHLFAFVWPSPAVSTGSTFRVRMWKGSEQRFFYQLNWRDGRNVQKSRSKYKMKSLTKPGTYLWIAASIAAWPTAVTCLPLVYPLDKFIDSEILQLLLVHVMI